MAQIKYQYKAIYLGSWPKEMVNGIDEGELKAARCYDKAAIKYFGTFALLNLPDERNRVETLSGEKFRQSFLMNDNETKIVEAKIKDLQKLNSQEIFEVMKVMKLQEIVDLCHYFGCGITELVSEIRKGKVIKEECKAKKII